MFSGAEFMSIPGFPGGNSDRGVMDGRRSFGMIAGIAVGVLVFLIVIVWIFGDSDDGEPAILIKIERPAAPPTALAPAVGGPQMGTSVIAENGTVVVDPTLLEISNEGPVPTVAQDGRRSREVYARTFDKSDPRPKIGIIVGGLGLGAAVTEAAVERLPPAVTLSFTPYGTSLQAVVTEARAKGHEVLLEVPLEPYDYPDNDPGQNTLLTGTTAPENPARLRWVMSRFAGYAGLINSQGGKYLASSDDIRFLTQEALKRGLYLVDNGQADQSIARETAASVGLSFARGDTQIDREPTREGIEKQFAALEALAKERGVAIGVAGAFPVTIDRVSAWAMGLEQKGIALAPISALTDATAMPRPVAAPTAAPAHPAPTHAQPPRAPPATTLPSNPEPAFETAPHQ